MAAMSAVAESAIIPIALAAPSRTTTEAADRYRRRLSNSFLRVVAALRASVRVAENPIVIPDRIEGIVNGVGQATESRTFADDLRAVFEAGVEVGIRRLERVSVPKSSVAAAMSFTLLNPSAVSFLQGYTFNLITALTQQSRETIQEIITAGYRDGVTPQQQARQIRQFIGLTAAQYRAVQRYRAMLESGDPGDLRDTLTRTLRDARYDASVQRAAAQNARLTRAQIERLVQRYTERSLKYRAEMIARTETIRAANAGQIEAWRQAQQQGLLSSTVRMRWIYTKDERTCDVCPKIGEMNPGGVPIGGVFQSPAGLVRQPPDPHPMCRCSLGLLVQ